MDPTEDLSARYLLKRILSTEPPRTPITRSIAKVQVPRRSSRLQQDAVGQSPQGILRRSLGQKMRESIVRKTATQRQSSTPGVSMSFDDGDTPRHILRKILMTEPVRSPAVHKKAEPEEPQPSSANSDFSLTGSHASIELSRLDLPDVTMAIAPSMKKGLSRKRSRRSLNVTAFEKRLKGADVGEESEQSASEQSSRSFSSCTSLSLKTPVADVRTEKRGLQRRVSNRRKITEEEFGAAVNKIELGGASTFVGPSPRDTSYTTAFSLCLDKLRIPDITADIAHCDTVLDAQPDATVGDVSHSEEESRSRSQWKKTETASDSQTEEDGGDSQPEVGDFAMSQSEEKEGETAPESQAEEGGEDESQPEVDVSPSEEEEGETAPESQAEEGGEDESQPEVDVSTGSPSEEEEGEAAQESQADEEVGGDSQPEVGDSAMSQSEEEEGETAPESQAEEGGGDESQPEVDVSPSEEEEGETTQEYEIINAQTKALSAAESEEEGNIADDDRGPKSLNQEDFTPQAEDEELEEQEHEPIGYRDRYSSGGVTHAPETDGDTSETECSEGKSKAAGTSILPINLEMGDDEIDQPHSDLAESSTARPDVEDPEDLADKENASEGSRHSEAATPESSEVEREWEDEEEVPSKTPAFVRQKRVFSHSLVKNIEPSAATESSPAKSKRVRKTSRPPKREGGLPKSYVMNVFKHFAKTKVSADVYPCLKEVMDKFFEQMVEDLETYAGHAKRKTIEMADAELLLRRQGHVNDKVPVEVLIEKYLRLDQRKLLIPIATSGNVVVPKRR